MNYENAINWLDGFQQFGMKLGLERVEKLLSHLDHPEKNMQIVHVAGTNGKGSVCRYLSSILIEAGYKVGLFTSPHLETIRERFVINDEMITKAAFSHHISKIKHLLETSELKHLQPTYFEICTVLAFLYFKEKKIDYIILEVGLGGRYDATNVIMPIASVITNISLDHQHVLGKTIEEIANEKAGIIKENIPVITAAQMPALAVISSVAKEKNAPFYFSNQKDVKILGKDVHGQVLQITSNLNTYDLETSELGSYQQENLAVVMKTIDVLQMNGVFIPHEAIQQGVRNMIHPGRMKLMQKNPIVLVDGAHNVSGMMELKKTITDLFHGKKIILIFGILADKNYQEMLMIIHPHVKSLIITKSTNKRAMEPGKIKKDILQIYNNEEIMETRSVVEAIKCGLKMAVKEDIIMITGSLYTISEALTYFSKKRS